ncbi:MAG: hypothetical protein AB7N76_13765 [Planctomycetota bacterium]
MRPWWLNLEVHYLVLGPLGLLIVGAVVFAVLSALRRERQEQVRRSVLDRIELAAARNLPLSAGLTALAKDHDVRHPPADSGFRVLGGLFFILCFPLSIPVLVALPVILALTRARQRREAELVTDIQAGLVEGDLELALRGASEAFPSPFPQLLGAAERNGTLLETVRDLRDLDLAAAAFRGQLRGSLTYPLTILTVVVVVAQFYMLVIHDRLASVFAGPSADAWGLLLLGLLVAVPLLLCLLGSLGALAGAHDGVLAQLARRIPFLGRAQREEERALLTGQLAAALTAGLDLGSALRLLEPLAGGDELEAAQRRAAEGASPAEALAACPTLGRGLIERLGALPGDAAQALAEARGRARARRDRALQAAASAAAPLALIAIGALVATYYAFPFLAYRSYVEQFLW